MRACGHRNYHDGCECCDAYALPPCPRCGASRKELLGVVHDWINDCPECRPGPQGPIDFTPPVIRIKHRRAAKRAEIRRLTMNLSRYLDRWLDARRSSWTHKVAS